MSKIVVLGAGVSGLAAGILLRRDGHVVTVLERDQEPVPTSPEEAWERWSRDGVTQFRQAHYLTSRGREVLQQELPDVVAGLRGAGAATFDPLWLMPPSITDQTPRDGDERFWTITARRSTVEQVLARVADAEPGLDVRRGVTVNRLVARAYNDTPHVTGVCADTGEQFDADVVVDAMGRRSPLPNWLAKAGARPLHEEVEDSGFIYYTRFYRSGTGAMPEFRAPLLTHIGTFSMLTLPSDQATWSVTLYTSAGDRPLKRLREPASWSALVRSCPLHAHWLDAEPMTGIMAMGGVLDRYRRPMVDGRPVATGTALLGDAFACTNPSLGRGMTLGLLHARPLAAVVRAHLDDPQEFADAWDAVTEAELTPWYRETVEEDRERLLEIEALRRGMQPRLARDDTGALRAALLAALPQDPDAFRAFLAVRGCLALYRDVAGDEQLVQRVVELAQGSERMPPPGRPRTAAGPAGPRTGRRLTDRHSQAERAAVRRARPPHPRPAVDSTADARGGQSYCAATPQSQTSRRVFPRASGVDKPGSLRTEAFRWRVSAVRSERRPPRRPSSTPCAGRRPRHDESRFAASRS